VTFCLDGGKLLGVFPIMKRLRKPLVRRDRFYNNDRDKGGSPFMLSLDILVQYYELLKKKPSKSKSIWTERFTPAKLSLDPVITWIGHASFLVQIGGFNILLDPLFGDVSFLYKRIIPLGFTVKQMPNIDFVLISHNHRDHMDATSLLAVKNRSADVKVLVPQGDKHWFDRRGFLRPYEHSWWEQRSFKLKGSKCSDIIFTFLPASHWSQRGLFDHNKSLWGSWMLEYEDHCIYFAGDTCYSNHFVEIAREFKDISIAMLPVGPCEPRKLLEETHLNAQDAGRAFLDLKAKHMIPMHWGAFPFGVEHFDLPIKRIQYWWRKNQENLKDRFLHCVKAGQSLALDVFRSKIHAR